MRQPKPYFRKQKQAWYVQINGQRLSLGTDKKQAWQKYYEIMAGNRPIQESTATVAELFERYLDWVQENRKPGTYQKIKRHLTRFAKFIGLRTKISTLSGADLSNWVESEKTWNGTTRNEGIGCVVRCFNWAVGKKHLKSHTMAQVPDKPARKRREVVFSQDDWKELRGYVKDQPFGDLLDFMWETGCRPLEARTMTADQIDLSNEVVIFQPSDDALCRYTEHGFLSMENNAAERLVKNPAIGRKNFLFVGGIGGGRNAAVFYSLVSRAKANGVEPFAWLEDLFTRLPYHRDGESFAQAASGEGVTSDELDGLLPDRWLLDHPDHAWTIDTIRRAERKQKEKNRRRERRKR